MSAVGYLMMLLIMIMLPTILYTFFFLINCPPNPLAFFRRRSGDISLGSTKVEDDTHDDKENSKNNMELIIMRSSSILGKDIECPICLCIFIEGEELREIKICKHLFHKGCLDKWVSTHFNCPVCRAFVSSNFKVKDNKEIGVLGSTNLDLWQGLPDSSGLV